MEYLLIFISAIFVNNIVLSQFLGICPFLGVSKKIDTAIDEEKARQQRESRRVEVTPNGEIVTTIKDNDKDAPTTVKPAPAPRIKKLRLADLGERKKLESESDIDAYLAQLRVRLLAELQGNDAIRLS